MWPHRARPGKVSVFRDTGGDKLQCRHDATRMMTPEPGAWRRAELSFRVSSAAAPVVVMFRAGGPATRRDALSLAVDDVRVTRGRCHV